MLVEISFCFFITYSYLKHLTYSQPNSFMMSKLDIAFLKFMSIILLFELNPQVWFYNWTLIGYAMGDVVIVWNQSLSLVFFSIGHLFFLSSYHQHDIYYEYYLPVLAIITFIILFVLTHKNPKVCSKHYEYVLYWFYIFILNLFLVFPLMAGYYGTLLFLLSDLSIGFNLRWIKSLEYPLYYFSLLYLRYQYT